MQYQNIGNFKSINDFVYDKITRLEAMPQNFNSLLELMFSEKSNILFEASDGYKINKVTYGECLHKILCLSKVLQKNIDLPSQSLIGIYMNNSPEWIEILWAILLCGYNPVLLNLRLDDAVIESVIADRKIGAVISDSKNFLCKTLFISDLVNQCDDNDVVSEINLKEIKMGNEIMLMSSGTSSNVKVCAYTAKEFSSLVKDSYNIIKDCTLMKKHYEGNLKLLTFLPFYHIFGFVAMYIWFGFFSRTFVLLKDFGADTILNTIRRHKVTHIFAVPLLWEKIYEQALKTIKNKGEKTYAKFQRGMKLAAKPVIGKFIRKRAMKEVRDNLFGESISFMISGGGAISSDILKFFNSIGYHLVNGYGMTEIGITSVELDSALSEVCKASIGKPLSSVEYKINDQGELLVKGPSLASKIWDENGCSCIQNDWFNTKDLAEVRDGKYYILGRKDDLIISSSGENINPNLAEENFVFENVTDCCLIPVEKGGKQTAVLLVSVPRYLNREKISAVYENCRNKLQATKLAGEISKIEIVLQPLIGENDFKINRKKIKTEYENGRLRIFDMDSRNQEGQAVDFDALGELEKQVLLDFATALNKNAEDISFTGDFFLDYGGSSLDYFALISKLQQEFNIPFPADNNISFSTVKSLCAFIQESL